METYREFDRVDFSQPEIMASLARAYAVWSDAALAGKFYHTFVGCPPAFRKQGGFFRAARQIQAALRLSGTRFAYELLRAFIRGGAPTLPGTSTRMSIQTFVYDADGPDSSVELDESVVKKLGERQLLWVDIVGGDEQELERVGTLLQLERESIESLRNSRDQPQLRTYTDYFQLNVVAVREEGPRYKAIQLDFLAGPNYVVTVHSAAVDFLKRFDNQLRGETKIGKLTSDAFLAALLDWHITSYFHVLSAMELEVDQLDDQILQNPAERRFLGELVSFRRRIGELRRLLTPHRDVFAALARVDFEAIANTESAAYFRALNERFELLIDAIESARDLVHGSFDLYATGTDLRTNDIVRVLTVATVLTGAASVVAGIMGMNFEIDLFKSGLLGFVLVIIGICALCASILGLARWRGWL